MTASANRSSILTTAHSSDCPAYRCFTMLGVNACIESPLQRSGTSESSARNLSKEGLIFFHATRGTNTCRMMRLSAGSINRSGGIDSLTQRYDATILLCAHAYPHERTMSAKQSVGASFLPGTHTHICTTSQSRSK